MEKSEELRNCIKGLEGKIEKLENRGIGEGIGSRTIGMEANKEIGNKIREKRVEKKGRKERRIF